MAALPDLSGPRIIDLRQLQVDDLDPLLLEETEQWRRLLDWDFRPSADLVRRFIRMQSLSGFALCDSHRVVGYAYYVCEEAKGLIGDLFISNAYAGLGHEHLLISTALRALWTTPHIERVESQLLMLPDSARENLPFAAHLHRYPRNFMVADLRRIPPLPAAETPAVYENWHEREQEQAARLIARSYAHHVDSEINDQYRTVSGARKFLTNIVQYPGCGSFFQQGSFVALDPATERVSGMVLASLVAFDVGHVTQICVDPSVQGQRVGYELMRRSILALARSGCRKVSLTVTSKNESAIRLYEKMGFETLRTFDAMVWDSMPGRRG